MAFSDRYYKQALRALISLAVIGGILALMQYLKYRKGRGDAGRRSSAREAA